MKKIHPNTQLQQAVKKLDVEKVKELLDKHKYKSSWGDVLYDACGGENRKNSTEIIKLLLTKFEPPPDILFVCCSFRRKNVIEVLIRDQRCFWQESMSLVVDLKNPYLLTVLLQQLNPKKRHEYFSPRVMRVVDEFYLQSGERTKEFLKRCPIQSLNLIGEILSYTEPFHVLDMQEIVKCVWDVILRERQELGGVKKVHERQ